jgi:hypothetical protein
MDSCIGVFFALIGPKNFEHQSKMNEIKHFR